MENLSHSQILHIERITRGQCNNPEWFKYRLGKITASKIYKAYRFVTNKQYGKFLELVLGKAPDLSHIPAIQWGLAHEEIAKLAYTRCTNEIVRESGVWVDKNGIFAASPDGILDSKNKVLEIKCPSALRFENLLHQHPPYIYPVQRYNLRTAKNKFELVKEHDYYYQVQLQMLLTGKNRCDFFVWNPLSYILIEVPADHKWRSRVIPRLVHAFKTYIIPRLREKGNII